MNTWKNILVVVVAVDRPLDYHVLRTIPFESSNPNCCVTELQGLVDVCKFQPVQVLVWQSRRRFYHRQGSKWWLGALERRARLVLVCGILVPLRIVFDDQRLAALGVFLIVSHLQSASDLLILSFFGLEEGRIFIVVLEGIMQQTNIYETNNVNII